MSLFVGNDIDGVPTVHITATPESYTDIKSGILPSTSFHSSLPYLKVVASVAINTRELVNADGNQIWTILDFGDDFNKVSTAFTADFLLLGAGLDGLTYGATIVSDIGDLHWTNDFLGVSMLDSSVSVELDSSAVLLPSDTHTSLCVLSNGRQCNSVVGFPVDRDTMEFYPQVLDYTAGIDIGPSFQVNGVSLLDYSYISTDRLNTTDIEFGVGNAPYSTTKFIRMALSDGTSSVKLSSNSLGTSISVGDNLLFDTSQSVTGSRFNSAQEFVYPLNQALEWIDTPSFTGYVFLMASNLIDGDIFIATNYWYGGTTSDTPTRASTPVFMYETGVLTDLLFWVPVNTNTGSVGQLIMENGNLYGMYAASDTESTNTAVNSNEAANQTLRTIVIR